MRSGVLFGECVGTLVLHACVCRALLPVCVCVCVCRYVVYISSVWCLHQRPLSSYFNTVWSAPIWSWSLCLCLLSKTLFISPCFSNPAHPLSLSLFLSLCVCVCAHACVCVCAGLHVFLFSEQMRGRMKCAKSQGCTSVSPSCSCSLGFMHYLFSLKFPFY